VRDRDVRHALAGERRDVGPDVALGVPEVEAALHAVDERDRAGLETVVELFPIVDDPDRVGRVLGLDLLLDVLEVLEQLFEVARGRRGVVLLTELLAGPVEHGQGEPHLPVVHPVDGHAVSGPRVAVAEQRARDPQRQRPQLVAAPRAHLDPPHPLQGGVRADVAHHAHGVVGVEVGDHPRVTWILNHRAQGAARPLSGCIEDRSG
jgi:hypothetical protein